MNCIDLGYFVGGGQLGNSQVPELGDWVNSGGIKLGNT